MLFWKHFYCYPTNTPYLSVITFSFIPYWSRSFSSICIFPEGTRNKTKDTFLPFHEGSFKIAEKGNVPIIPMTIVNSAAIFEDHFPKIKKATVVIEYGKPIYMKDLDKETRKSMGTYVQNIISETYFKNKELI